MPDTARYLHLCAKCLSPTFSINSKLSLLWSSLSAMQSSCADLLNKLVKYCKLLTVFHVPFEGWFIGSQLCWCPFTNLSGTLLGPVSTDTLSCGHWQWHFVQHCWFHLGLWEHLKESYWIKSGYIKLEIFVQTAVYTKMKTADMFSVGKERGAK